MLSLTIKFEVPANRDNLLNRCIISATEYDRLNEADVVEIQRAVKAAAEQIAKDFDTIVDVRL